MGSARAAPRARSRPPKPGPSACWASRGRRCARAWSSWPTRAARSRGRAGGLALAAGGPTGEPVFHDGRKAGTRAVTGDGTAGKAQLQAMVARLLVLAQPPRPADAADALGLAVCHLGSAGLRTALAAEGPAPDGLTRAVGAALAKESRE